MTPLRLGLLLATAVAAALPASVGPVASAPAARAAGVLDYTTTVQKAAPSAANCTAVTPSGSSGVFGNWFEVIPSAAADLVLTSIVVQHSISNSFYTVAVGIGGVGAETQVTELTGLAPASDGGPGVLYFRPAFDGIPAGSRVSVRLRKGNTNTTNWCVALTYLEKPLAGLVFTTAASSTRTGASTPVVPSNTSWANGAWATIVASAATDMTLSWFNYNSTICSDHKWEVDIGTGGAGSEVVVHTAAGYWHDNGGGICQFTGPTQIQPIWPLVQVASGSRLAMRVRKEGAGTNNRFAVAGFWSSLTGFDGLVTAQAQTWAPAASAGSSVSSGGSAWADGSWVQFIASTATDVALTAFSVDHVTDSGEYELEIGVGGSGSEVGVRTLRGSVDSLSGDNHTRGIFPAIDIPSGQRVAVRLRSAGASASKLLKLGYIANPDFDLRTSNTGGSYPAAATGASVTPSGSAWNDSSWQQLAASTSANILVLGVSVDNGAGTPRSMEIDIGVGGAGAESVVGTARGHYDNALQGESVIEFPVPIYVPSGSRLAVRGRFSGTNTTAWNIGTWYVEYTPGGAGTSLRPYGGLVGCCWPFVKPPAQAERKPRIR